MVLFQPQPQQPLSPVNFIEHQDQPRNDSLSSVSSTICNSHQTGRNQTPEQEQEQGLLFTKRPLPVDKSSLSNDCCFQTNQSNQPIQSCNHTGCQFFTTSPNKVFPRSDTTRTPSFSRSDTSATASEATSSSSFFSSSNHPSTTPSSHADDSRSTIHLHHHHCHSTEASPKRPNVSLLSAALLQDDLNEGPQIRAAQWSQACGILRKGTEGIPDAKKNEMTGKGGEGSEIEGKQEPQVAKKPAVKAHFVEPQKPIRDEKRRVSLPPKIIRPALSFSPDEQEAEEGPASLGQQSNLNSSFVKRAQSSDASYGGIFSNGKQTHAQSSKGRSLVFREPPEQERRSGARQASLSSVSTEKQRSSSTRPTLLSTMSERETGTRGRLETHSSRREVVSDGDGDPDSDAVLSFKASLLTQRSSSGGDRARIYSDSPDELVTAQQNRNQLKVKPTDPLDSARVDSSGTPAASRKSALTFADSPAVAHHRAVGKSDKFPHVGQLQFHSKHYGDNKSNALSEDEGSKPHSDCHSPRGLDQAEQQRFFPNLNPSSSTNRISTSPAHARPLPSRQRINSRSSSRSSSPPPHHSKYIKGKNPITSRSSAHANVQKGIMPFRSGSEDEEDSDQDEGSDDEESQDESLGDSDDEVANEDDENDSLVDDDESSSIGDLEEGEKVDDELLASRPGLKRNHSLSRSVDDTDSASILAPSVDSRDLNHPMSFSLQDSSSLPSPFDETSSPHLSFEDLSTQSQMKSFVRERHAYTCSPPLSPKGRTGASLIQKPHGLGKGRQFSWHLKLSDGKKVASEGGSLSNFDSGTSGPSSFGNVESVAAPKTPRTLSGGFTPNARCSPSQPQVSSVTPVAKSPPSGGAWSHLRHYLEAPSSPNSSANSTPVAGAFFHLNHLHQQLDQEQERRKKVSRASYLRSQSHNESESYFNQNDAVVRSAPSTPPTAFLVASTQVPSSALDLIKITDSKASESSSSNNRPIQPQKSIRIIPHQKDQGGSSNKKRRPRTAGSTAAPTTTSHFKQDMLDRLNPRRRRRSGGKEEMEWGL